MSRITAALPLILLVTSIPAGAQKFKQPWTKPQTSFESRVESCKKPAPMKRIALDDWTCTSTGPISRITWWGTLSSGAQAKKPFYFAIYTHSSSTSCKPGRKVWSACVKPYQANSVGVDCKERRVFQFDARFRQPFNQVRGKKYWLQISEADAESATPGAEDFRWSGHRRPVQCPAGQMNAIMTFSAPLYDECDGKKDDLAFQLWQQ